jgi:hypothetical protein
MEPRQQLLAVAAGILIGLLALLLVLNASGVI